MQYQKYKAERGEIIKETPIMESKNPAVCSCETPLCAACQLSKMSKSGVHYWTFKPVPDYRNTLKIFYLSLGAVISVY